MCRARPWHERSLQDRPGGRVLVPGLQPAMCLASLLDTASSALGPAFMPGGSGSPAPIVQLALASFSMSGLIRSPRMLRASKRRAVRFDPLEARPQAVRDAAIRQSLDSSRPSPLPSPGSTVNWRLTLFLSRESCKRAGDASPRVTPLAKPSAPRDRRCRISQTNLSGSQSHSLWQFEAWPGTYHRSRRMPIISDGRFYSPDNGF